MKKVLVVGLIAIAGSAQALGIKPEYIKSMTYSQCKADPTVRFVAGSYRQKYPSVSLNQILSILCRDAR